MIAETSDSININDEELRMLQLKYSDIVIIWPNLEEIDYCDNCLGNEPQTQTINHENHENHEMANECVFCDLCNAMCHQQCYGGKLAGCVPEGQWFCGRCQFLVNKYQKENKFIQNIDEIMCEFCPNIKGIVKQYTVGDRCVWSHLCCADMFFGTKNKNKKQDISPQEVHRIKSQSKDKCDICLFEYGLLYKCQDNCSYKFHITCGREKGIINSHIMAKQKFANQKLYCLKHLKVIDQDLLKIALEQQDFQDINKKILVHRIQNKLIKAKKKQVSPKQGEKIIYKNPEPKQESSPVCTQEDNLKNKQIYTDPNPNLNNYNQLVQEELKKLDLRTLISTDAGKMLVLKQEMAKLINIQTPINEQRLEEEIAYYFVNQLCVNFYQNRVIVQEDQHPKLYNLMKQNRMQTDISMKDFYYEFKKNFVERDQKNY